MSASKSPARARYEDATAVPMLVLALLFLVVYSIQVIFVDDELIAHDVLVYANWAIWALFLVDVVTRTILADQKIRFLREHPIDVLSVALPVLRPLRALKVFAAGQNLLSSRSGILQAGQAIVFAAALLVYIGALALLDVEQGAPDAIVDNFGDALWWALVTVTTVGYGDLYPVTTEGRIVAAGLMVVGISVLGAVTATAASWLIRAGEEDEERDRDTVEVMSEKIDALERKIDLLLEQRGGDRDRSPE